jgi:hypothetical protein
MIMDIFKKQDTPTLNPDWLARIEDRAIGEIRHLLSSAEITFMHETALSEALNLNGDLHRTAETTARAEHLLAKFYDEQSKKYLDRHERLGPAADLRRGFIDLQAAAPRPETTRPEDEVRRISPLLDDVIPPWSAAEKSDGLAVFLDPGEKVTDVYAEAVVTSKRVIRRLELREWAMPRRLVTPEQKAMWAKNFGPSRAEIEAGSPLYRKELD